MSSSTRMTVRHRAATCFSIMALCAATVLTGCSSDEEASAVAGDPATPASSGSTTTEPTDEPSTPEPTGPPSATGPTSPPTPTEPTTPSDPPTTTAPDGRLTAAEYAKDWKFGLGDVEHTAKHVRGKEFPDCTGLETKNALTSRGCSYGVKVTFKALNGKVIFTHMILEMANEAKAKKFANDKSLSDGEFEYAQEDIVADFDKGRWEARSAGKYVVITLCTGAKAATDKQVKDYLHYANADFSSALLFR